MTLVRWTVIFAAVVGPAYFLLKALDARDSLFLVLALTAPFVSGAIERWLERRAQD